MEELPIDLLSHFNPNPKLLADVLYPLVNKGMLEQISQADYGHDASQYLHQLEQIKHNRALPNKIQDYPMEVLALTRWIQPESDAYKPQQRGERGHILRAFCCSILLEAGIHPILQEYGSGSLNESLVSLVESTLALGKGLDEAALSSLSWQVQRLSPSYQGVRSFFAYAILLLSVLKENGPMPADILTPLVEWVETEVIILDIEMEYVNIPYPEEPYLLNLTFHRQRHDLWKSLSQKMVERAELMNEPEARQPVMEMGRRMLGFKE